MLANPTPDRRRKGLIASFLLSDHRRLLLFFVTSSSASFVLFSSLGYAGQGEDEGEKGQGLCNRQRQEEKSLYRQLHSLLKELKARFFSGNNNSNRPTRRISLQDTFGRRRVGRKCGLCLLPPPFSPTAKDNDWTLGKRRGKERFLFPPPPVGLIGEVRDHLHY